LPATLEKALRASGERAAGDEDDTRRLRGDGGRQQLVELDAGHLRHHDVAHDDVEALPALDARQPVFGALLDDHVVVVGQRAAHEPAHQGLVVDDQHRTAPPAGYAFQRCLIGAGGDLLRRRQRHAKRGALAGRALDRDLAAQLADDAVTDRQPQPGPDADRLGGEEGIEDARLDLGGDAVSGIADLDGDPTASRGARDQADLVLVGAALRDGLRGVDDQVDEHLAQARLVGDDRRHRLPVLDQARVVADLVARQPRRRIQQALYVDRPAALFVAA